MERAFVASLSSGMLLGGGSHAAIGFEVGGESVTLALSAADLTGLLTLCVTLSAQAAAQRASGEVQVLPVDDLAVGRTASAAVIVRLASEGGAALTYRLERGQAEELRDAISTALAHPVFEQSAASDPTCDEDEAPRLDELLELRRQCLGRPAALRLVDRCLAMLADLDAANDEGQVIRRRQLIELADAAREHLREAGVSPPAAS